MKRFLILCVSIFAFSVFAEAKSKVYLCIDKDGHKEYRNTNITKGCKKVSLPYITTVSDQAPKKSVRNNDKKAKKDALNDERKRILNNELRAERNKLAVLQKEYQGGEPERLGSEKNYAKYQTRVANLKEKINRTQSNIDALNREISKIK